MAAENGRNGYILDYVNTHKSPTEHRRFLSPTAIARIVETSPAVMRRAVYDGGALSMETLQRIQQAFPSSTHNGAKELIKSWHASREQFGASVDERNAFFFSYIWERFAINDAEIARKIGVDRRVISSIKRGGVISEDVINKIIAAVPTDNPEETESLMSSWVASRENQEPKKREAPLPPNVVFFNIFGARGFTDLPSISRELGTHEEILWQLRKDMTTVSKGLLRKARTWAAQYDVEHPQETN